ncbi:hypothetical protein [Thalassomonas sp. RHCl1]|uniref:hypothetical protein n=1 Tax=Thalassomonas sp. RHCl1 TaxID=2995320 RepID=UPI00248BE5B3|nr:hypothetical protein [Thalassomonas sp. RHCl1]
MEFLDAIFVLAFGTEGEYKGKPEYAILVFSITSSFFGTLVVILDALVVKTLNKNSFLKLSYPGWKGLLVFLLWGVGAGIGGFLGAAIGIFEINRIACVVVGTSWPLVLPRLLSTANSELSTEKIDLGVNTNG